MNASQFNIGAGQKMTANEQTSLNELEILVFDLNGTQFGADISVIHEITRLASRLSVAESPDFVCGTVRIGRRVISVLDMRAKLSMSADAVTTDQRVLVIERSAHMIGWLVDAVTGVIRVAEAEIEPPVRTPDTSEYVRGVAFDGERPIMLINPEKVASDEDVERLSRIAGDSQGAA